MSPLRALVFILMGMIATVSNAQKDSLEWGGILHLQATVQSGTVEQYGGNVIGDLFLEQSRFKTVASMSYVYNRVNGLTIVDDSWNYGLFKWQHKKRIYPITMVYYGFAKTFGLDNAMVAGAGTGVNIAHKNPLNFLHLNLISGYLEFDYDKNDGREGVVLNTFVQANKQVLKNKLSFNWELHAYFTPKDAENYGMQNRLRFSIPLGKVVSVTITQTSVYNNITDLGKKQLNTMTMFGCSFSM